jgi:predicted Zn-dependent protease
MRPSAVFLAGLLLAGCTTPKADIAPGSSPPKESPEAGLWLVMEKAEGRLLTSGKVVPDEALQTYANRIACDLAPAYCGDLRVYVVRRPGFNASMAQATLNATLVLSLATAMAGVAPAGDLVQLAALGYLRGYSRDQEREADDRGFDMMAAAGYAPGEAPKIWSGIIAEREAAEDDEPNIFLATHPPSDERFRTLSERAEELAGRDAGTARRENRFLEIILPYRAEWLEDELDMGRFARVQVLLDRLKKGEAGLGVVWYYQGELHRRRGEEDDLEAAIKAFKASLAYDDAPQLVHRGLGLAYLSQDEDAAARAAFEHYLAAAPGAEDVEMIRYYLDELEGRT